MWDKAHSFLPPFLPVVEAGCSQLVLPSVCSHVWVLSIWVTDLVWEVQTVIQALSSVTMYCRSDGFVSLTLLNPALLLIWNVPSVAWALFAIGSYFVLTLIMRKLSLKCYQFSATHWLWYSDTSHVLHDPVWLKEHLEYTLYSSRKCFLPPFLIRVWSLTQFRGNCGSVLEQSFLLAHIYLQNITSFPSNT